MNRALWSGFGHSCATRRPGRTGCNATKRPDSPGCWNGRARADERCQSGHGVHLHGVEQRLQSGRLERYLSLVWDSGGVPVVVLIKADLCEDLPAKLAEVAVSACGAPLLAVSSWAEDSAAALQDYMGSGRTEAYIGSSGVGKSTLINRMPGNGNLASGDIRRNGKGRGTTTRREMFLLPGGGIVIDTPGIQELALNGADLASTFADLAAGCRYAGLNSRQIGEEKLTVMFAAVGGKKNVRRLMREANKKRRF